MKINTVKKVSKELKNILCPKIKLCQKENLKESRITMILIQDLQRKDKNKSDLKSNGKWRDSLKEIQVTRMITKDIKMQRSLQ